MGLPLTPWYDARMPRPLPAVLRAPAAALLLGLGGCGFAPPAGTPTPTGPLPTPARAAAPPSPVAASPSPSPSPRPLGAVSIVTSIPVPSPRPSPSPGSSPSPSPGPAAGAGGGLLAFERDGNIWVAGSDGSGPRALVSEGDGSRPRWSPDGRWLVFTRGRGTAAELALVPAEGGPPRRLTSNARPESGATWAPRGDRVAYTLPRSLGADSRADPSIPEEVWVVDVATGQERKVADGFDPAWSPDGSRLAYATNGRRRADGPAGATDNAIHVMDADGTNDHPVLSVAEVPQDLEPGHRLPFRPATFRLRAPAWAPDGRMLLASADGHTGMALTFDERGRDLRVWTPAYEGGVGRASWSPRGDRLAVEVRPPTGVDVVTLVEPASGRETRIGGPPEGFQADSPTWAPDGRRLALVERALTDPRRPEPPRELRTYGADGARLGTAATGALASPDWNPARP